MFNFRIVNDTQYIPWCQQCNFCASWRTQMNLNVAATLWCKRYFGLDVFQIVDSLAMLYRQLQHNMTSRCYRSGKPWNGEKERESEKSEKSRVVSNLIINIIISTVNVQLCTKHRLQKEKNWMDSLSSSLSLWRYINHLLKTQQRHKKFQWTGIHSAFFFLNSFSLLLRRKQMIELYSRHSCIRCTYLSNGGALISHRCCSGTVCQTRANFTIAAASIKP